MIDLFVYLFDLLRGRWISELEASLVYFASSRTARATQRNPVLKNIKQTSQPTKKKNDVCLQSLSKPVFNVGIILTSFSDAIWRFLQKSTLY